MDAIIYEIIEIAYFEQASQPAKGRKSADLLLAQEENHFRFGSIHMARYSLKQLSSPVDIVNGT